MSGVISNNSSKTSKQGITVVKTVSNQSDCSRKSSFTREIPYESLKISDVTKTSLTMQLRSSEQAYRLTDIFKSIINGMTI